MSVYNSRRYGEKRHDMPESPQNVKTYADHPAEQPSAGIKQENTPKGKSPADLFGEIAGSLDADKLLIAALLLLLMKEGGDKRLILALGYILL